MSFLDDLAARRRFGARPGLDAISSVSRALGNPERRFKAIHVAGTNGKGAVCAILDSALRHAKGGSLRIGRYTSPHLVSLNERFFIDGYPVSDETLERLSVRVSEAADSNPACSEVTFFEALTAVAFLLFAESSVDLAVLECGLGGRLDATNICDPSLSVITRIGLDHCSWLGDSLEKIAAEKAGIAKPGVPVVLGRNAACVRDVVESAASRVGAPFVYAPDVADESEIPDGFQLGGSFNRENAVTAIAALKTLGDDFFKRDALLGFSSVSWPGRFQRIGRFLVDGAHNPPAAAALVEALGEAAPSLAAPRMNLVFSACADKDVESVLKILAPVVAAGWAVKTANPRSIPAAELAATMKRAGIDAKPAPSVAEALRECDGPAGCGRETLVCGSLFLAGEALACLGVQGADARFDPSELLYAPKQENAVRRQSPV